MCWLNRRRRGEQQETTATIIATEQALSVLVRVVLATSLAELGTALSMYSFECMAIDQFFADHEEWPWTHAQWLTRAPAMRRLAAQLSTRLQQAQVD